VPQRNGGSRPWRRTVAYVLRRDGHICWICGQPGADSADHVIPVAHGGTDHPTNLRAIHHKAEPRCNLIRGDKRTPDQTRQRLANLGHHQPANGFDW
jgi:5-methylcytosine-specific restriction endonuclease McrA